MENQTKVGMNRTGMQMSPKDGARQVEYAQERAPHPEQGSEQDIVLARADYIKEALRVGSVPVPATGKGLVETAVGKLKGDNPEVLFDKLGERAAYERSGVRLYQAMIGKVEVSGHPDTNNLLSDLNHILEEEFEHFQMLTQVITDMGGDPTAQTPCADISAVSALGMIQIITDPRTTLAQCLQALLSVEMTDNAAWELLIELAEQTGHDELVPPFQKALTSEEDHETRVKKWLRQMVMEEAT